MQTAELMFPLWDTEPKLVRCEGLYLSSPETILRLIDEEVSSSSRLLVIAHNPGMSAIISHLADQSIEMPTAAVALFTGDDPDDNSGQKSVASERRWRFETWMRPKALPSPSDTASDDAESDSHPL